MLERLPRVGEVRSVSDLLECVNNAPQCYKCLYRGQNVDEPLLPRFARRVTENLVEHADQVERRMLEFFRRESVPFLGAREPSTNWDWLAVAQHQGLPTRLLDWTASPLIGLWFAVSEPPPTNEDNGAFWIFAVDEADLKVSGLDEIDPFDVTATVVFQPRHLDPRITAQQAWFSMHDYREEKEAFVPLDQHSVYMDRLQRYVIPNDSFPALRRELRKVGFTRASVFPDLGGLCSDIEDDLLAPEKYRTESRLS